VEQKSVNVAHKRAVGRKKEGSLSACQAAALGYTGLFPHTIMKMEAV